MTNEGAWLDRLLSDLPVLQPIYEEHKRANKDAVLSYLLLEDFVRALSESGSSDEWNTFVSIVNDWSIGADQATDDLLVLAILQPMLESRVWPMLRDRISPQLRDQLREAVSDDFRARV